MKGHFEVSSGERALTTSALALMKMSDDESATTLDACLRIMGEAVSATRVVLFELSEDNTYADATYEWHHPDQSSQRGARYGSDELPETFAVFNRGQTVVAIEGVEHPYGGLRANMVTEDLAALVLTPIWRGSRASWVSVFSWHGPTPPAAAGRVTFCERATAVLDAGLARQQELRDQATREQKLLHSQRLESLGLLAGGIAHDFNNVLQGVLGLSELLRRSASKSAGEVSLVDELIRVARRASQITNRLLIFSRQEVRALRSIRVADALSDAVAFLEHSIPEDRQFQLVLDAPEANVLATATDFEQAVINLCTNASAAMPEGGRIEVGCRPVPDSGLVEVWVRDTGTGMTPEQIRHARDPFFTTRPAGEGTGLGLTMVDSLVRQASGTLRIESVVGEGTRVSLRLPVTDAVEESFEAGPSTVVTGTETILVAEDDPVVLRVNCSLLERAGFTVLGAPNGKHALELFRAHQDDIQLVVTDVIMPAGGAAELYAAISQEAPTLPFVFATGYDAGTLSAELLNKPSCRLLQKPYEADVLLRLVREMIDRSS